ncbi:hypothetical protein [Pseudomonas aeruginosa]|uniref:hypothetical protein n=1 Tax=Pseudomonas aeruginosa TaxID=287 RepID=UPI00071BBB3C|nr:hypothetical protein [Pseudomonas aeruginosa]KSG99923.1 hypothetical protein AO954_04250 [Pseudomonas aeruginosa]
MSLFYQTLIDWPFPAVTRRYGQEDCIRFARGFGAGASKEWATADRPYLEPGPELQVLPMSAVALADGEFWQKDPRTGIAWQQIVHTQETLRVHRPLASEGELVVTQTIDEVFDRGTEREAPSCCRR